MGNTCSASHVIRFSTTARACLSGHVHIFRITSSCAVTISLTFRSVLIAVFQGSILVCSNVRENTAWGAKRQ